MSARMNNQARRQRGFSLIELMVALVLGLIVVGGLIQVLISNRTAYRLQESSNFLQQNLRYASDRVNWSLRMADFWGGASAANVTGSATDSPGSSGCGDAFTRAIKVSAAGGGGVFGYDGGTSFPITSCLSNAANYMPGSDVLVVRYADADPCAFTGGAATTANCAPGSRTYVETAAGGSSTMFPAPGGTAASFAPPALAGATTTLYVYPLRAEIYYLQPCSNPGASGCSAASDDGNPIPTLMRMRIDNSASQMKAEPIVEGIEQLQFEYGLANGNGPDGKADAFRVAQWLSAKNMSATTWPQVIAVRVSMVARGRQRDVSVPQVSKMVLTPGCQYSIAVGGTLTLDKKDDCDGFTIAATRPDQFARRLAQQTVQLRNRVRGMPTDPSP